MAFFAVLSPAVPHSNLPLALELLCHFLTSPLVAQYYLKQNSNCLSGKKIHSVKGQDL